MNNKNNLKFIAYLIPVALWIVYVWIAFSAPINTSSRQFVGGNILFLRIVQVSIYLPYLMIFLAGSYGIFSLWKYINVIKTEKEEKGFYFLKMALIFLVAGIIIASLLSSLQSTLGSGWHKYFAIAVNYTYVLSSLLSFAGFYFSSTEFLKLANSKEYKTGRFNSILITFILSLIYLFFFFTNPNRTIGVELDSIFPTYYLPDWFTLLTLVIPFIISWYLGFMASLNFYTYYIKEVGIIYKDFFGNIINGINSIIYSFILIASITSFGMSRLLSLGIWPVLILIYSFVVIQGIGFLFVIIGISKLSKIEKID